jgi:hypothetical protein
MVATVWWHVLNEVRILGENEVAEKFIGPECSSWTSNNAIESKIPFGFLIPLRSFH